MEDIEKGVETTELWVERLRVAAVEHYSRHHVPQDLLMQKKTADYVKQNFTYQLSNGSSVESNNEEEEMLESNDVPMKTNNPHPAKDQVKIHAEEMSESETAFMLEQGQIGLKRMGEQLGPLAGWLKDIIDQEFGPDWQVIVGKKGSFGSCLSPMAGHYINFSVAGVTFLIFRAN